MQTAKELFVHELSDMLDAERRILEALGEQSEESSHEGLQSAFENHREQTQGQIERLEQCFEEIEEGPQATECSGIRGIIEEHQKFKEEEEPSEDLIDVFNVAAASKVEHYEIASYEALIRMAEMLDQKKVSKLLNQNLKEETQMLRKVESLSKKVKPENLGVEEEEEELEEEDIDIEASDEEGEETEGTRPSKSPRTRTATTSRGGKRTKSRRAA